MSEEDPTEQTIVVRREILITDDHVKAMIADDLVDYVGDVMEEEDVF
jgi:hypothetical protein